jgi:hypothetical protein
MEKLKREAGSSIAGIAVALVIIVLLVIVGLMVYKNHHKTFTSYDDCINNGGQWLTYDGAIQFDACKGSGPELFLQYSAQNMPNISSNQTTKKTNVVLSNASDSSDLINYLTYNYSGCNIGQPAGSSATGYFKILEEVPSGFAELNYGCSNYSQAELSKSYIIAMKLSSGWVLLSPTNNMFDNGVPSCLLVDMFRISKSLTPQCEQNTGYNDGSLRSVDNP